MDGCSEKGYNIGYLYNNIMCKDATALECVLLRPQHWPHWNDSADQRLRRAPPRSSMVVVR